MSARATKNFFAHLNPFAILRELWVNRELLGQFTRRNFHVKHKGSSLGILWSVLNPLLILGLYYVVFSKIFKGRFGVLPDETGIDFALALLLGLTVFHFLAEIIAQSPAVIVASPNLVKKVVFPLELLPVANLGASFINFAISMGMVVLGQVFFGHGLTLSALWIPVFVLPVLFLGAGIGWLLASLGVFFRDVSQVTQFATLVLMYVSAVFFPTSKIIFDAPPGLWTVLRFNPVLHIIELLRYAMLWDQNLYPHNLALVLAFVYVSCAAVCLLGYATFASLRSSFADVL